MRNIPRSIAIVSRTLGGADVFLDGKQQSDSFTVNINEKIDMTGLNSTTREGYKLDGWYTSGGVKWDEQGSWGVTPEYCDKGADASPIYQSNAKRKFNYYTVTLTAHWTPDEPAQTDEPDGNKYTITFDSLGGTFADLDGSPSATSLELESGAAVTAPASPVKEHYDFAGWYPELPEAMPAADLTVTATWEPTVYHVGFFDGSKQLYVLDGIFGSEVKAPKDPVKEGSVFAGWNTKGDGTGEAVTFPLYMRDVDLLPVYATWKLAQEAPEASADVADAYTVRVADPVEGAEYVLVPAEQQPTAKDWANAKKASEGDVVFGGLAPATAYDVWARMAETDEAAVSEAAKCSVTTSKEVQVAPVPTSVQVVDRTTVAVAEPDEAQEYALVLRGEAVPEGGWSAADADGKVQWTELATNADYDVYARYKETATKAASAPSSPAAVHTDKAASQVVAPTARENLVADGQPQALVEAGGAQGATMLYALGTDEQTAPAAEAFSDQVPTAVDAGTYYVWYYGKGDADHDDSAPACVVVTVAEPTPSQQPEEQLGKDGTPCGPGASEAAAEKAIMNMEDDGDPTGSMYGMLQLKSAKQTKKSVTLSWSKPAGAVSYVVYGNKCGKQFKMAKIAKLDKAKLVVKAAGGKKLAKGTYYKFIVVALDKAGKVVSTSKVVHVATAGKKKASNYKKVKVSKKVLAKAKKLKKGKSLKLKAKAVKKKGTKVKFHTKLRYESTNNAIATVSSKGVVKAKKKGTCFVYAYVQSGVAKKVKVVVK